MFEIPFWMIFKVTIPQISNEERVVVEKKEKVTQQFKQRFDNDLIRYHLAKRQYNKTLQNIVTWNESE